MHDVALDSGREKRRLLGDKTDLRTKPPNVEVFEVHAVELDNTRKGVIEPLDEANHGGLPRTRRTDECSGFAGGEGEAKVLHDEHTRMRRVLEVDVLERHLADTLLRLETVGGHGVNSRNAVDGLVELSRGTAGLCDRLHLGRKKSERERTDEDCEDNVDNSAGVG